MEIPNPKVMNEDNYFSWNNLNELADINSHITYASTILENYQWEPSKRKSLRNQLHAIINKQNDKLLNISVIGEFTTGKSTFINSLVGYNLLATNVIQGTTVAITMIEYSPDFAITRTDFEGIATTINYPNIQTLSHDLHAYTTDPSYAHSIDYITVKLPSEILKNGFRIIDTPGTNSTELWHEDITIRAINQLSDLSIILVDATRAMPESLTTFIDNTLEESIKNCAFIINKIDCINEDERDDILKYVKTKVEHNFEMESPFVLPFSAVALANTFSSKKIEVDNNSFLITTESLKKLLSYTAKQRVKAQAHKTLQLTNDMYSILSENIIKLKEKYNQKLEQLERTKQVDFKPFITKQITIRQKQFTTNLEDKKNKVIIECDNLVQDSINTINKKIEEQTSIDNLSEYIKGDLSEDIKEYEQKIIKSIQSKYKGIRKQFNKELNIFQQSFEEEFDKLEILPIKFDVKPQDLETAHFVKTANISPVKTLITEELSKENWAFGGSTVTGTAIGTAVCPGIGSAIGFFIGLFTGAFFAPNKEKVIDKVKNKLSIPLKTYYQAVENDCIINYNNYMNLVHKNLESEIWKYYSTYHSKVQEEMTLWHIQHHNISKKIQKISQEIDSIKTRQTSIKHIIFQL